MGARTEEVGPAAMQMGAIEERRAVHYRGEGDCGGFCVTLFRATAGYLNLHTLFVSNSDNFNRIMSTSAITCIRITCLWAFGGQEGIMQPLFALSPASP